MYVDRYTAQWLAVSKNETQAHGGERREDSFPLRHVVRSLRAVSLLHPRPIPPRPAEAYEHPGG